MTRLNWPPIHSLCFWQLTGKHCGFSKAVPLGDEAFIAFSRKLPLQWLYLCKHKWLLLLSGGKLSLVSIQVPCSVGMKNNRLSLGTPWHLLPLSSSPFPFSPLTPPVFTSQTPISETSVSFPESHLGQCHLLVFLSSLITEVCTLLWLLEAYKQSYTNTINWCIFHVILLSAPKPFNLWLIPLSSSPSRFPYCLSPCSPYPPPPTFPFTL